ncbi:MAG TPA: YihY/virulence factor BrkB family protein [Actinomycetospora sp.]|uniref:YihY/virulence factor BrkB family protein n=1 Tax=Actinomycetospora sp. TaxID=1872135 RepID=UPI002F4281C4
MTHTGRRGSGRDAEGRPDPAGDAECLLSTTSAPVSAGTASWNQESCSAASLTACPTCVSASYVEVPGDRAAAIVDAVTVGTGVGRPTRWVPPRVKPARLLSAGLVARSVVHGVRRSPDADRPPRSPNGVPDTPPGSRAATPTDIPPAGWWQIVRRAFAESSKDKVSMLAGGVAFFGFLAVFPALIALVSLYGLVADPAQAAHTLESVTSALPETARPLVAEQLQSVVTSSSGGLTTGLIIAALAALFSASSGTQNLMAAVNIAYDETEGRNAVKLRALALALTLGAVVFVIVSIALVAVAPIVLDQLGGPGQVIGQVVRWVLLVLLVVVGLAVLYRVAPDRDAPRFRWVTLGSVAATVLWVVGSVLFSLYVDNFGSYNKTYGALAGVVVLMLWIYLTSYIVLLGAEINAESELQTVEDTTKGRPQPMGSRGATKADDVVAGRKG